jgi:hypothetical protein
VRLLNRKGVLSDCSTRESLARVADADIEASLAHLGPTSAQAGEDTHRTASYAVGTVTSDGQWFRVLRPAKPAATRTPTPSSTSSATPKRLKT